MTALAENLQYARTDQTQLFELDYLIRKSRNDVDKPWIYSYCADALSSLDIH